MKLFTLQEANEMIPRMEMIMERMQIRSSQLREAIARARETYGRDLEQEEIVDLFERHPELNAAAREMEQLLAEIDASGAEFKGLDLGLVDFPAEMGDEIGLLCWQYGEKEITHWHTLEDGFAGRQLLPQTVDRSYLQ
jgi:hypothetical protein